jgi:hypothetical protein
MSKRKREKGRDYYDTAVGFLGCLDWDTHNDTTTTERAAGFDNILVWRANDQVFKKHALGLQIDDRCAN